MPRSAARVFRQRHSSRPCRCQSGDRRTLVKRSDRRADHEVQAGEAADVWPWKARSLAGKVDQSSMSGIIEIATEPFLHADTQTVSHTIRVIPARQPLRDAYRELKHSGQKASFRFGRKTEACHTAFQAGKVLVDNPLGDRDPRARIMLERQREGSSGSNLTFESRPEQSI